MPQLTIGHESQTGAAPKSGELKWTEPSGSAIKDIDVCALLSGKRQWWVHGNLFQVLSEGRASSNDYLESLIMGERLIGLRHWISSEMLLARGSEFLHISGRNDWVNVTYSPVVLEGFLSYYSQPLSKLTELIQLPNGWDSYSAKRISATTAARAVELLIAGFQELGRKFPIPFVAPCPDGSIQLEWELPGRELEIVIPPSDQESIRVLRVLQAREYLENATQSTDEVIQYLSWLIVDEPTT